MEKKGRREMMETKSSMERKKILLMWLAAVIMSVMFPVCAHAATYNLGLNNAWISGNIASTGNVNYYKIRTTKPGFITIDYQGWSVRDSYVQVLNGDLTVSYDKHNVYYSSSTTPLTYSKVYPVEAGLYYVKVWAYGSNTGDYRLRGGFRPANNTETESNNDFSSAMSLSSGSKITGFLSLSDRVDFYRMYVPSRRKVTIQYTGMIYDSYISLWNSDYQQIMKKNVYYGSESAPKSYTYDEYLNAGTYYIKIEPYSSSYSGRYQLVWRGANPSAVSVSSIRITGNERVIAGRAFQLYGTVSPSNATNKSLTWTSSDTSVASVSSSGKVTTKKAGYTTIKAKAKDGSGVTASCTVIVRPTTCTAPYITQLGGGKVKVTWGQRTGVAGYEIQYAKNSSFSGAKSVTCGSSSTTEVTISNLEKTTYLFRMRSYITVNGSKYYGDWSAARSVAMRSGTSSTTNKTVYRAVLIGEANYYPYASNLSACRYDANAMAAMLKKTGYSTVSTKIDASKSTIQGAISSTFRSADSNDVSLFYYSGHGSSDGSLYSVKGEKISTATLTNWLKSVPGNVIVILDSCFSGAVINKSADGSVTMKDVQNFNSSVVNAFANADTSVKSGEMCTNKFKVLTACRMTQTSGCYSTYSLFTEKLISGAGFNYSGTRLSTAPADSNSDKKLSLEECWSYTYWNIYGQDAQRYPTGSSFKLFQR